MSIEDFKRDKIESVHKLLGLYPGFQFAESLTAAFVVKGEREAVQPIWLKKTEPERLEPVIIEQDRIRPHLTQTKETPESIVRQRSDVSMEDVGDLSSLLESLQLLTVANNSQIQNQNKLTALRKLANLPYAKLEAIVAAIKFESWSDDLISDLFNEITDGQDATSITSILLVHAAAFTKITTLTSSASRLLVNSLIQVAKNNGRCVVFGLLLPLLFQSELKKPQSELISKVVSEALNPLYKTTILQAILSDGETYFTSNLFVFTHLERKFLRPWTNEAFQIIHSLCTSQPLIVFTKSLLFDLLKSLQVIVQSNPKDKPSMQLLLALANKHHQAVMEPEAINLVEAICEASTMFLKRAVSAQLTLLKKRN
ncbi:hypothetical protein BDF20DRAFT_851423 [Mycotypha africana]|uniref:uncharacterized protein n=1 Tax=Mycotypha africana TaxID=64632 RepID=UPI0023010B23|nr:uncharacterized protein BDF20DRAFT_851423 [Mycotypha africana]KAI8987649.1 hypothetical protein BDF20DRAFT_851423 [Mycotypha africana]